jgi:hypothetical protein
LSRRCDYCGGEFRFPDIPRKDTHGRYYSAPGEYYIPFQCPHCRGFYCNKHRLPENHKCIAASQLKKRAKSYAPIMTRSRDTSSHYAPKATYRKLGSYAKVALILSILLVVAYSAANTTLISDLNGFIQSQTPGISSTLTSLGETISKTITPTPVSISEVEKLIFKYTNDERRKAGLKELVCARVHRANILKDGYDKLGVGVGYDGTYYYSTQDFW